VSERPAATAALLLESIHPEAVRLLSGGGVVVRTHDGALGTAELVEHLRGVSLLGIRSKTQLTAEVFQAAPDLLAVGAFCIGTNQIDLDSAAHHGVAVFNAPFSNTRSVVELAIAEIVCLLRRLTVKDAAMHQGIWDKSADGAHEVRGRRLGIVGYGNIGTQLSVLAEAMGMSVFFYDTADRLALGNARRCATLDELLEVVDVVSLHVDGRPANSGFFGEEELSRMRHGSLLLNLSRGFVIDPGALRKHIENGHLAGAAVDVFPEEPMGRGDEFRSHLQGLSNVILTPHIGGSTEEAQEDIGSFVAGKLRDYLLDGTTALSVNFPQLALPRSEGTRIAHMHRNVPGVLAKINTLLGSHDVNVEGQLLGTRGELGYVLTDIRGDLPADMTRGLREFEETIGLRLLP
jgi:D-3-phosphoglycerate dehydrogenase